MSLNLRLNDIVDLRGFIRANGCVAIERRDLLGNPIVDMCGCDGTPRFAEEWSKLQGINLDEFRVFLAGNRTPCDCSVLTDIDLLSPPFLGKLH